MKLPRMQETLGPFFPLPQSNLHWDGRRRPDLSDDAQVHFYHGWWTLDELYEYEALPAIPYKELRTVEDEYGDERRSHQETPEPDK